MQNFNQLSYQSFFNELKSLMPQNPDWNSTIPSETGNVLLSFLASITTSTEFFASRRLQESFLETSQSPLSTMTAARMLSNSLIPKNPSVAVIDFIRNSSGSSINYVIPAHSTWAVNGSEFYNGSEILFSSSLTAGTFQLIEGTKKVSAFTSDGSPYQKFYVSSGFSSGRDLIVNAVDPITKSSSNWDLCDSLILSGRNILQDSSGKDYTVSSNKYEASVYQDGSVQVKFGDGKFGNIPVAGSTITITYFEVTGGSLNGLPTTSEVSLTKTPTTFDITSFQADFTSFTCTSVSSGSAQPSYLFYKEYSPMYYSSLENIITPKDLEANLLNFRYSGSNFRPIKSVRCISERDSVTPNPLLANTVTPVVLIDNSIFNDFIFRQEISNFLSNTGSFNVVTPIQADIVTCNFTVTIMNDLGTYSRHQIMSIINSALASLIKVTSYINSSGISDWDISSADNTLLGKTYSKSDFYRCINEAIPDISFDLEFEFNGNKTSIDLEVYQCLGINLLDTSAVSYYFK